MAIESLASTMLDEHMVDPPDGASSMTSASIGAQLRGAARDANAKISREARGNWRARAWARP